MLRHLLVLLGKDLKRTVRNPIPVLIHIMIPLLIAGLIGMTFGSAGSDGSGFASIKVGVVDQDDGVFSQFLSGVIGQEDFAQYVQMEFMEEEEALQRIGDGELSAVFIIPVDFTDRYLEGEPLNLELIKNPAQYIYPTIAQEGIDLLASALNVLARNFRKDFQEIQTIVETGDDFEMIRDFVAVTTVLNRAVERMEAADAYLTPPLVQYERKDEAKSLSEGDESEPEQTFSLFSFILVGMSAMFGLMLADNCMRDLYRESRFRTLERYRTLVGWLGVFISAKVLYSTTVVLIAGGFMYALASVIYGFVWQEVWLIALLLICYAFFGAGFMGFIAAIAGKERRADVINTILVMSMALIGGGMWPLEQLPAFLRDYVSVVSPVYWFSSAVRGLQPGYTGMDWWVSATMLASIGAVFVLAAAWIFNVRMQKGLKA